MLTPAQISSIYDFIDFDAPVKIAIYAGKKFKEPIRLPNGKELSIMITDNRIKLQLILFSIVCSREMRTRKIVSHTGEKFFQMVVPIDHFYKLKESVALFDRVSLLFENLATKDKLFNDFCADYYAAYCFDGYPAVIRFEIKHLKQGTN